jgi:hypothetical protein
MYSKSEAQKIRTEFWSAFGLYMNSVPSASGMRVNWLNYRTGAKGILLRSYVDRQMAISALDIDTHDQDYRELYIEQFAELKAVMESSMPYELHYSESFIRENDTEVIRFYMILENVNLYRREDWPAIFEFLRAGLIAWDEFWNDFKDLFLQLQ